MPRRKDYSPEQIATMLRKIEVEASTGQSIAAGCRKAGITDQTFYRWRREYGGLNVDQAKRLKALELENNRLKKVVADQALDMAILKEAARGNF